MYNQVPVHWKTYFKDSSSHTVSGEVYIIDNFEMKELNRKRRIWIYLPPDYGLSTKRYPVLYMQDGQNLFDSKTSLQGEWKIDKTLDMLFFEKKLKGIIVVGIEHGNEHRVSEYLPWYMESDRFKGGGEGDKYSTFIVHTLKPFIDKSFRTKKDREFTGIAGSSIGGVISLYTILKFPDIFSKAALFSLFSPDTNKLLDYIDIYDFYHSINLYLDCGTEEDPLKNGNKSENELFIKNTLQIYYSLQKAGFPLDSLKISIEKGGRHTEKHWSERFISAVKWLFGNPTV